MIFTLQEFSTILIITLLVSFIFSRSLIENFLIEGLKKQIKTFSLVLPFVTIHELAHKVVALQLGIDVTFSPAYILLFLGVLLKQTNIGLIFFTNSYLSFQTTNYSTTALIGLVGPVINLVTFVALLLLNKSKKSPTINQMMKINLYLFIFNILPLPGFDGSYLLPITYF